MSRFPDWQLRLEAFLAARRSMPFAWGTNDCCIFACDAVEAVCGYDPAVGLRAHRTAQDALAILEGQHGGIGALATARLGPEIAPLLAAVGDVALLDLNDRPTLGVCAGDHWLGPGAAGLVVLPMAAATRAWRCARA